jgi:hypothetical protein
LARGDCGAYRPSGAYSKLFLSVGNAEAEGLDHQLDILRPARGFEGLLIVCPVLFDQLQQGLIEGLHAVVLAL